MAVVLNEQSRRRFVALEARALGRGGVSLMARISGLARSTIYHGLSDIGRDVSAPPGRIRKTGGGRKKKTVEDPTLVTDLESLVEPATRGAFLAASEPVISVDTKKKELVGNFKTTAGTGVPKTALNWSTFMISSIPS